MKFKDLVEKALYYISVPKCVYCNDKLDYDDRGLCKTCISAYNEHKKRNCSRCSNILSECTCSNYFLTAHGVKKVIKLFRYSKTEQSMPSNYLIYSLKQDNRRDVISFLSDELSDAISLNLDMADKSQYILTNVPRRKKSVAEYGFDHASQLAKAISQKTNIKYEQFLISKSRKAQKSVHGRDRLYNAKFDYKSKRPVDLKGKTVIIVDDIVTTGSSMSSCAMLLRGLGARKVIGASIGIAYRDSYTPNISMNRF